jgi:hypothetical protein
MATLAFVSKNKKQTKGGKDYYEFIDKEGDRYVTWDSDIAGIIPIGPPVDCEVDIVQKGEYTNRTIKRLANMVEDKKTTPEVGGRSPQSIRSDQSASIESQVAAKLGVDLLLADKCPDDLKTLTIEWIAARLK